MEKTFASRPVRATKSGKSSANISARRSQFVGMALNMSWQLAIVVLVPIIAGVQLDKSMGAGNLWLFVGLALALIGSVSVMWRTLQAANKLPVPKLTDEQRREIRKSYEEDDKDE